MYYKFNEANFEWHTHILCTTTLCTLWKRSNSHTLLIECDLMSALTAEWMSKRSIYIYFFTVFPLLRYSPSVCSVRFRIKISMQSSKLRNAQITNNHGIHSIWFYFDCAGNKYGGRKHVASAVHHIPPPSFPHYAVPFPILTRIVEKMKSNFMHSQLKHSHTHSLAWKCNKTLSRYGTTKESERETKNRILIITTTKKKSKK